MGTAVAGDCSSGFVCCNDAGAPSSTAPQNTNTGRYYTLEKVPGSERTSSLVTYLQNVYKFGIGIAAILAVFMIGMGAFQYIISSAGNAGKMGDGKDMMTSAIFGLVLVMVIYITLYLINPDMLKGSIKNSSQAPGTMEAGGGEPGTTPTVPRGCTTESDTALASAASSYGVNQNLMKAIIKCGEGCNPNKAPDGGCGYGQLMPAIRSWCGIGGTSTESCNQVINDTQLGMNCAAKLMADNEQKFGSKCGGGQSYNTRFHAAAYNYGIRGGKCPDCAKTTNDYCGRVENCK